MTTLTRLLIIITLLTIFATSALAAALSLSTSPQPFSLQLNTSILVNTTSLHTLKLLTINASKATLQFDTGAPIVLAQGGASDQADVRIRITEIASNQVNGTLQQLLNQNATPKTNTTSTTTNKTITKSNSTNETTINVTATVGNTTNSTAKTSFSAASWLRERQHEAIGVAIMIGIIVIGLIAYFLIIAIIG